MTFEKRLDTGAREPLYVSVTDFKGIRLDVRHYYLKDGSEKPGKRGISLPVGDSVILARAILEAYNETVGGNLSIVGETPA